MKLDKKEFRAMNNPVRRFVQRAFEYPCFRRFGLMEHGRDILEIGCGSGYGAFLLNKRHPKSYVGIDIMPEQIALAKQYDLPGYEFFVMDASDLSAFGNDSKDIIVDFGILHHVEGWELALEECNRVLRKGGRIFVEEPSTVLLSWWDRLFHWNHPKDAMFGLDRFEKKLSELGLVVERRLNLLVWVVYAIGKKQ
jgi:ubiquinone/menaquinone biosynthesis C-methylase UbiE